MYVVVEENREGHDVTYDIVGPWFLKSDAQDYAANYSESGAAHVAWLVPEEG